jgi:glucosamine-6-phosphate deaminase
VEDIEMAVPISPEELLRKRQAIFKHQSQKDSPVFPGNDKREFWQRAEDRNRTTAELYDQLGPHRIRSHRSVCPAPVFKGSL